MSCFTFIMNNTNDIKKRERQKEKEDSQALCLLSKLIEDIDILIDKNCLNTGLGVR